MDAKQPEHWFVYTRTAGRITAVPANGIGWAVLLGSIVLISAAGFGIMALLPEVHPLLRVAALSVVILAGLLLIFRLVLAKGRPSSGSSGA
ncbi:MAG TPA: hypothetical protein VGB48_01235 [Allosphingosinicella sp.]|jgi:ABC-type multidrug transport system permease subunit